MVRPKDMGGARKTPVCMCVYVYVLFMCFSRLNHVL